ncbi:MAG: hypothetical protein JJD97_15395, partial [Gemmatimonadaceae bacterium]|nr:hypothetical protein [Gemmatimonadaceae bacterium]
LTELDRYRGDARTWVLFAHVLPRLHEREILLRYLDAIGIARDSMAALGRDVQGNVTAVQLYLYDLSAGARTSNATATSAQLPEQPPLEPRFACAPD